MQIIEYYPPIIKRIKEIQQIAQAEDKEFSKLISACNAVSRNMFVTTADINGVERFEKILGISPKDFWTLEERKMYILTTMNQCKMTLLELVFMISVYCNEIKLVCDYKNYELYVNSGDNVTGTGIIYSILDEFLPLQVYIIFAMESDTKTEFTENVKNLELETTVKWWEAAWYLDGSVKLDGSRKLNAMPWRQKVNLELETFQPQVELFTTEPMEMEMDTELQLKNSSGYMEYETLIIADVQEQETGMEFEITAILEENFDDMTIVAQRNLWFLDGSVKLDGSRKLNAKIIKENL